MRNCVLAREALGRGLAGDGGGPGDVLVRRVGARADQRRRHLDRHAVLAGPGADLADLVGQVGRVGAVDERLQLVEVDLDEPVVVGVVVRVGRCSATAVGGVGDGLAPGGLQVGGHVVVVGEHRAWWRRSRRPCCRWWPCRWREMVSAPGPWYSTMAPVPPDTVRTSATFRMTSLGDAQPLRRAGEAHADDLGPAHVEREAGHHVDGVGAAHADGHHAEAAGVGRVAVGADHHPAGEGVVLQHDLVDDAAARLPEADAVLGRHARAGSRRPRC